MKKLLSALASLMLFATLNTHISTAHAQGTAFSYQGQLQQNGQPANGSYDFAFTLYATNMTGVPIAGPVTNTAIAVSNGLFLTTIDFGNVYSGQSNWLEIAVSTNDANAFSTLAPRQQLLPVPYAITAANLSGSVSAAQLPANVITNGASGVNFSGNFSGNGSGITNLPGTLAEIVASGTNIAAQPDVAYDVTNSALVTISLPTNANVGDIVQVDGSGAGGWQVVGTGNSPNDIWTQQTNAPTSGNWQSIASSADGTHVAAVAYGDGIWTSTNSGVTWIEQSNAPTSAEWFSIASSSDGTHLAAAANGGGIWTSTNSGNDWVQETNAPTSDNWNSIASSSDGIHLAAVAEGGGIWTSVDGGMTWAQSSAPNALWQSIASSADGAHLAAGVQDSGIWTSTNSGTNWSEQTLGLPSAFWISIASSADGTHLAAVGLSGGIYTSINSGTNWAEQTGAPTSAEWSSIASSADGTHLVAVASTGGIWTSSNNGTNWTEQTGAPTSANWYSIAASADSAHLVAGTGGRGIWTGINDEAGVSGTSQQFQYLGNGVWQPLAPYSGYLSNGIVSIIPSNVVINNETGVTLSGNFTGNLAGSASLTNAFITNSVFAGNGHGLTSLMTSNLIGTFSTTNLSGTLQAANFQSTTFTNFVAAGPLGPTTFTFTTHGGRLIVTTDGSGSTSTTTGVIIGMTVSFDSKLINTNRVFVNVATHAAFVPQTFITNGVTAGSHTITLTSWNGTSTDLNDNFDVTIQELPY